MLELEKCHQCGFGRGFHTIDCAGWLPHNKLVLKNKEDREAKEKHLNDIAILNQHTQPKGRK